MKRVLVAAALWWAAASSLAGHPALSGPAGTASCCSSTAHGDCSATPAQNGRAIRAARYERRAAGAPLVALPPANDAPGRADAEPDAPVGPPVVRASLVASVTGAPRAPPRA